MCLVGPYLDDGSPYWSSPLGSVVLSLLRGVGMASDRTEVTAISSSLQDQCGMPADSISPCSFQGPGRWSGHVTELINLYGLK
jgi:hypothetical protein